MKKNQNRDNRFFHKLGCLLIILSMVLCLVACNLASELEGLGILDTTASATKNSTKNTTKGTTATSGGDKNQILDLEYELTQSEVDAFYDLLEELEAVSLVGEDLDAIDALTAELEEMFAYLDAQNSIAMVYHYSHTLDEVLEAQYLDCVDICTEANDAYIQMVKRVYLSDSPAKDYLFEGWTEQEIAQLLQGISLCGIRMGDLHAGGRGPYRRYGDLLQPLHHRLPLFFGNAQEVHFFDAGAAHGHQIFDNLAVLRQNGVAMEVKIRPGQLLIPGFLGQMQGAVHRKFDGQVKFCRQFQ